MTTVKIHNCILLNAIWSSIKFLLITLRRKNCWLVIAREMCVQKRSRRRHLEWKFVIIQLKSPFVVHLIEHRICFSAFVFFWSLAFHSRLSLISYDHIKLSHSKNIYLHKVLCNWKKWLMSVCKNVDSTYFSSSDLAACLRFYILHLDFITHHMNIYDWRKWIFGFSWFLPWTNEMCGKFCVPDFYFSIQIHFSVKSEVG